MTELTEFQRKISTFCPDMEIRFNESLKKHTSFRVGGEAEAVAFPKNREELAHLLKISVLLDCGFYILGAGTNVLAPDAGLQGLVICLKDNFAGMVQLDETHIQVMSGVTMARAAVFASRCALAGMEFAHGIPGTIGGGVYMNAGAYGGEISQICESVEIMDYDGTIRNLPASQMDFSYRHSRLEEENGIVISAVFSLTPGNEEEIRSRMKELAGKRLASQPLDLPSAGSAFKRPVGGYAAALIDQAGLKGFRVGDAAISEKHAGFAVNLGNATAEDVTELLRQVSDRVFLHSGIRIEPEIRIW